MIERSLWAMCVWGFELCLVSESLARTTDEVVTAAYEAHFVLNGSFDHHGSHRRSRLLSASGAHNLGQQIDVRYEGRR
jgi:hypothetical protein